jgi:ubiquinone/menaquinone biosynthesis C-methylase UbiE
MNSQFFDLLEEHDFGLQHVNADELVNLPENPDVFTASADYAARFSGAAGEYMLRVQERIVASMLSSLDAATVLDVGGGHGQLINLYEQMGMSIYLHGSSPVCFKRIPRRQLNGASCIVSPVCSIPLPDKSIDVVVSVRLLSHVDNWDFFIGEMCRIAKKAVVVDYPSARSLNILTPLLFDVKKKIEKNTRSYLRFNREDLQACFRKHGFNRFSQQAQFILPMVVHRMGKSNVFLRSAEIVSKGTGLTALFGSPIIMKATREVSNLS